MKFKNLLWVVSIFLFLSSFVSGADFSDPTNRVQYTSPSLNDLYSTSEIDLYWPGMNGLGDDSDCEGLNDFWIGIVPGGCSPMVVTSDLLEEQNVPVFCQLYSVQINPLIDVYSIDSISFKGDYPDGVSGVSFYPAQAAIRSHSTLAGSPTSSNIGYVVIVLKQERVEENMEDWIAGNLTARIRYDAESAYGTGKSQYYLDDSNQSLVENSFWNGMGYLNLKGVGNDEATIEIMSDKDSVFRTVSLKKGETSSLIYFPGYYCRAGLKLKLNDVVSAEPSVLLSVDGDDLWVREGSRFLNEKCRVSSIDAEDSGAGKVKISCSSKTFNLEVKEKADDFSLSDEEINNEISASFKLAEGTVEDLIENYRSEKKVFSEKTYGEEALFEQIKVAGDARLFASQMDLALLFIKSYPNSDLIDAVEDIKMLLGKYDYSNAGKSVYVSNDYHTIGAKKFRNVDEKDKRVDFVFDGVSYKDKVEGKTIPIGDESILISNIERGRVTFKYYKDGKEYRDSVGEDDFGSLNGKDIKVTFIEVNEVAYVSLIPEVNNKYSEANFSFNIGIEKRAVELSPEKAKQMLENLEGSIEKWETINERIGNLVSGLKGACFATSAFLTVKNMVDGFGGSALARKKVMEDYKEICKTDERYRSMTSTQCYNALSSQINGNVSAMADALSSVNMDVDSILKKHEKNGVVLDKDAYVSELRDEVSKDWSYEGLNRGDLSTSSQISAVLLVEELKASGVGGVALSSAEKEMNESLKSTVEVKKIEKEIASATVSFETEFGQNLKIQSSRTENSKEYPWSEEMAGATLAEKVGIAENTSIQGWVLNGKNYLLVLAGSATKLNVDEVYTYDKGNLTLLKRDKDNPVIYDELKRFVFTISTGSEKCSYVWDSKNAKISYYESGTAKGKPALVPFDLTNGWYAKISSDGYYDSGDIKRFTLCNIGVDAMEGTSDDKCQTFDSNTAGAVESIGGCLMNSKELGKLYSTARSAILEAMRGYGKKTVMINGRPIETGKPSGTSTSYECQDFMSPADCKMLFNVCDPVICPTSRCNMGGRMHVSNVVQTGILGSILLCLPNAKEGIVIPVCLTGIHAGIESFVSILKSERDCLQTSLDTGENVGICDEITSIYLCEFFWNQFSSFFDTLVPSVLGSLFGGNQAVKGGGEYLLVNEAWKSTQASVSYFKDVYAQNAFAAFNVKSVADAGSEVCKVFVGTSVPTSADMLDNLLEPESPTQFYAHFSSKTFSEATIPSTAQYKVYYHIYAGKDSGVQYKVYLKDPPESSYYKSHATVNVDSGYVAVGESADESIDFTAPEGYKQLCVSINGKDECGFTSVSTSVAVDYVSAKYVEDQVGDVEIKTEDECISGTASVLSLASLNLQSGVEETLDSDISLKGIVRVCASENPGNSVGASSRWRDVGHCGDESMDCWLDVSSVKDALATVAAVEDKTVSELESGMGLIDEGGNMSYRDVGSLLDGLKERITDLTGEQLRNYTKDEEVLDIFNGLDKVIGIGEGNLGEGSNANRARAYMLKARVYQNVVKEFLNGLVKKVVPGIKGSVEDGKEDDIEGDKLTGFEDLEKVRDECEENKGVLRQEDCPDCRIVVEDPKEQLGEHLFCCEIDCEGTGVEVRNNRVYYEGEDLLLELDKKAENRYLIESGIFNNNVGTIINGNIEIYEDHFVLRNVDKDVLLHIEEDYIFRDGKFVGK